MSELIPPLRERMGEAVDEAGVQRIWRGVVARRAPQRPIATRLVPVFAAVVIAALAIVWMRSPARVAGPLTLADGHEIGAIEAASSEPVALSDGSSIALSQGARLVALESTGSRFSALLVDGHAELSVKPGGPRRWAIECGLVTVEVVGTRFAVDRSAARVRVEVTEGVVLVRGERVPDRVRRLVAGEAIEVADARDARDLQPDAGAVRSDPDAGAPLPLGDASASAAPTASAAPRASWRDLAQRGDHKQAYEALGREGIARQAKAASVDDLLALADVARLSGHAVDAIEPLQRVVDGHAGDARAGLAAFTLGRVALDSVGRPALAVSAFARALSLGLPGGLREDASARLVEAHARAGDRAGARAAAEAYNQRYPNGRHAAAILKWSEPSAP